MTMHPVTLTGIGKKQARTVKTNRGFVEAMTMRRYDGDDDDKANGNGSGGGGTGGGK